MHSHSQKNLGGCVHYGRQNLYIQVASATSPSFTYVSNLAPNSSLCRAAAPRLRPLQLLLRDCIDPLQLLLPVCVRFSSPIAAAARHLCPLQLLLATCIRFSCCSPIASTSAAAPRLRPLNCSPIASDSAAAPRLHLLQLLPPDCVRFNCCSPIVSASTAAPPAFFAEFEVQVRRSCVTSLVPPHEHPTSVTHTQIKI